MFRKLLLQNGFKGSNLLKNKLFQLAITSTSTFSYSHTDTIYALSSGFGKCGVSIIRVSGKLSLDVFQTLTTKKFSPIPRKSYVLPLLHPLTKEMLDRAMVLWFSAPNSFTGEDVCEFHVHGGPAVINSVLNALSSIDGLQPAEAGEFTKRAFLNNKMDLTEVEGLGDLIHAETEAQRVQALKQMEGSLSNLYKSWSTNLLKCVAHLEAHIDFSEDEHLDDNIVENILVNTKSILEEIEGHLNDRRRGEIVRNGLKVVIIGQPNVGKSSLLNMIIQRPASIVSPIAGTTRDIVETAFDVGGYPVLISDTAGLCETNDIIEQEGVNRAKHKLESADYIIMMADVSKTREYDTHDSSEFFKRYCSDLQLGDLGLKLLNEGGNVSLVLNKLDIIPTDHIGKLSRELSDSGFGLISCKTSFGMDSFINDFAETVKHFCTNSQLGESPSVTQQRHRAHLQMSSSYLTHAVEFMNLGNVEFAAEYLKMSLNEIAKISGKICVENILDVVFKDFCIGK